jgi:pimeloyl-ACP methyl ester carboxylesterase
MLAQSIEDFCAATPSITEITLVCHSMGGLVGRLLLEGIYGVTKPSWFSKIKRLICICTPHLGAPQALSECMGVEGSELISPANIKLLSGDHRYPAGYELLPAEGNSTLWDITNGMEQPLDFYQSSVAQLIGLDLTNLGAAQQLRAALNLTARPKGVDYQFIFGTGQKTDKGVDNLGDGTVPIWSASYFGGDATIGRWSTAGDHVGILATLPLTLKIRAYFGLAEALLAAATQPPTVVLSLNKHVYAPNESMHVLVIPHDEPTQLDGTLITHRVTSTPPAAVALTAYSNIEVSYRGGATKLLQFTVPAPADTGAYRLSFAPGSHASQAESPGWFAVSNYASH